MKSVRLRGSELADVLLQVGMLYGAGLDLGAAFDVMAQGASGDTRTLFTDIAGKIRDGTYPDEAMQVSGLFPRQCCGLVAAGLESGKLDGALKSLEAYYRRMGRLERQLKSALIQPFVMLGLSLGVFLLVILKILPVFDGVYASLGGSLDGMAGAMLQFGMALRAAAPWVAVLIGIVLIAASMLRFIRPVREKASGFMLKIFGDAGPMRDMNNARYMQAMSMGMDSGLVPEESARMAASLYQAGTKPRARYDRLAEILSNGGRLADAGSEQHVFGPAGATILDTGVRAGTEPEAARRVADMMLDDAEARIEKLSGMIEPAVTAFGAALTGLVILAAMLPLLGVMNAIG